jgi:chromosome segregation ATPase
MARQFMNDNQLEFDLGEGEVATDISVEDSVEEGGTAPAAPSENQEHRDELDTVSEGVQKRISKLTARMREAERQKDAAISFAQGLQSEKYTLQQKLVNTDYSRLNEAKGRLDTQQATLKAIIRKAREEGDIDTETEASQRLTDLTMESRQVTGWLQTQQQQVENFRQPMPQQQAPQAQQKPTPSPRAEDWASRNTWYGQDRVATYAAWGIHQTLVEQEGVEPDSDEYYNELDRRLREELPTRFATQTRQQRSAPAVAPASRSSGINSARRTVRLSPSQIAIAKKLNVPLEEYAKYVKD